MSELARRRQSRDLWISRGHVRAVAALVVGLSATSFILGYLVGRDRAPVWPAPPADEALIDLLARVEANARPDAAVEELSFPDALRGVPAAPRPLVVASSAAPMSPEVTEVPAGPGPTSHSLTSYTVLVVQTAQEAEARSVAGALLQAGITPVVEASDAAEGMLFRVTVGSWSTAEAADIGVAVVRAAGREGSVVPTP